MLGNYKYLDINIPYYDYIRASIFVQDLRDNFGEEVPLQFNEAVLIWILYDDFLNQIKKGTKNENISSYLKAGKKRYYQDKIQQKRILKPLLRKHMEMRMNDVKELMQMLVEEGWLEAPKTRNAGYKLILSERERERYLENRPT